MLVLLHENGALQYLQHLCINMGLTLECEALTFSTDHWTLQRSAMKGRRRGAEQFSLPRPEPTPL